MQAVVLGKRRRSGLARTYLPGRYKAPRQGGSYRRIPRVPMAIVRQAPGYARIGGNYGRYGRRGETKYFDVYQATVTIGAGTVLPSTTATVTPAVALATAGTFLQIAQGDQPYQRNGREIVVKRIMIRGDVTLIAGAVFTEAIRLVLVQDMQANGAAPTVGTTFDTTGQTPNINSFNNLENSRRFKILADKFYTMNALTSNLATAANPMQRRISIMAKCNMPITYDASATTGALATIRSNNVLMFGFTEAGSVSCQFTARIRYTDH